MRDHPKAEAHPIPFANPVPEQIDRYLTDTAGLLADLRHGELTMDADIVHCAAKALGQRSLEVGAVPLGEVCAQLAKVARTGWLADAVDCFDLIDHWFAVTVQHLSTVPVALSA